MIYHTNVMMSIGETYAVVCLESVSDKKERKNLLKHLKSDGKQIIEITANQMASFAGNTLQVIGQNQRRLVVMSTAAYEAFTAEQLAKLQKHSSIVHSPLTTIETYGGGSARCMMAELFLPKK